MRLRLISHASTSALRQACFPGDEALDRIGSEKLQHLTGTLPMAAHCLSSTALRTRQTATALGLSATPEPLLDDCNYGNWSGLSLQTVQQQDPAGVMAWLQDPAARPHGGESLLDMCQRVINWMSSLATTPEDTIAVTHPAIIRLAILHVLGAGMEAFWRIEVNPLTLTDLRFQQGRWTLRAAGIELAQNSRAPHS